MAHEPLSWFPFLRTEADLVMTYLDVAGASKDGNNALRAIEYACRGLAEVEESITKAKARRLTENEVLYLKDRCAEIRLALMPFTRGSKRSE